jgi:hypothetical protein
MINGQSVTPAAGAGLDSIPTPSLGHLDGAAPVRLNNAGGVTTSESVAFNVDASGRQKWKGPNKDYEVPMATLNDSENRPLKVITIGAGVSGIMMAYKIQEMVDNVEHVIYDRNASFGGTWYENRYPGYVLQRNALHRRVLANKIPRCAYVPQKLII